MTNPGSDSASFWDSLLDRLEEFLEAEQDAPRFSAGNKDSNHIWKLQRPNRDSGGHGVAL